MGFRLRGKEYTFPLNMKESEVSGYGVVTVVVFDQVDCVVSENACTL